MANTNAPFGFRPIKSLTGTDVRVGYYKVASTASRIGKGDLVKFSSGTIIRETSATAVGPWLGVAMIDSGVISTAITNFPVCEDPSAVYIVQTSSSAFAQTNFGTILKANCGTAPDTNTGSSKDYLTTTSATASNGVRALRLHNLPNNTLGAYNIVECMLNADTLSGNLG